MISFFLLCSFTFWSFQKTYYDSFEEKRANIDSSLFSSSLLFIFFFEISTNQKTKWTKIRMKLKELMLTIWKALLNIGKNEAIVRTNEVGREFGFGVEHRSMKNLFNSPLSVCVSGMCSPPKCICKFCCCLNGCCCCCTYVSFKRLYH